MIKLICKLTKDQDQDQDLDNPCTRVPHSG